MFTEIKDTPEIVAANNRCPPFGGEGAASVLRPAAVNFTSEPDAAAARYLFAGGVVPVEGKPAFTADWTDVLFLHFSIDPKALQPHVPFELDLHDGLAYVSLVAFTQRNLRPTWGGRLGALLHRPVANHEFLNLRTYVRHAGEPGIQFLAEWVPNRLSATVGPLLYGLPLRLARVGYDFDPRAGRFDGALSGRRGPANSPRRAETFGAWCRQCLPTRLRPDGRGSHERRENAADDRSEIGNATGRDRLRFEGTTDPATPTCAAKPGLEAFLVERYTAYTRRHGVSRRFRIAHAPWQLAPAYMRLEVDDLVRRVVPWWHATKPVLAHYSPGVFDVAIGPPERLEARTRSVGEWLTSAAILLPANVAIVAGVATALFAAIPAWVTMWAVAFALYFAAKRFTLSRANRDSSVSAKTRRRAAAPFCHPERSEGPLVPHANPAVDAHGSDSLDMRFVRTRDVSGPAESRDPREILRFAQHDIGTTRRDAVIAQPSPIDVAPDTGSTSASHRPTVRGKSVARAVGYLYFWPGMDARAFFSADSPPRATLVDGIEPLIKIVAGAALVWGVGPHIPPAAPLLRGWVAMVGLVLMLHFGAFHLVALLWQRAGVNARPIMDRPTRSTRLAEFWGERWNRGFHQLAIDICFKPLVRRVGATGAMLATFALSGVVHDLVISLPARAGYGLPTLYFLFQGLGVLIERRPDIRRSLSRRRGLGWLFTAGVTALPLPLLFHAPFVTNVILPFLNAIAAGPR